MEVLTFYLTGPNFKYLICCVYRPPSSSLLQFNEIFFNQILDKFPINSKAILVGDFNINLYNPLRLLQTNEFTNMLLGYNYFPVITLPAMINENNRVNKFSLIDHIWSNFKVGHHHFSGILKFLISDHLPIFYIFKNIQQIANEIRYFRIFSMENKINFRINVLNNDFSNIFHEPNPDTAFTLFYESLFKLYEKSFPIKKKRVKSNMINEPWVTPKLKMCIRKKYKLYNLLRRGLIQRGTFLKYKSILSWVTKKIRNEYYNKKFLNSHNSKTTWSNINNVLKRKTKHSVISLVDDEGVMHRKVAMTNYFNHYFCNVASNLVENLPPRNDYESLNGIERVNESCFLFPTNEVEVSNTLNSLPNKGNSVFDIKPRILNIVCDIIVPILTYLYNVCIANGIYPRILKIARVVPVYKSGCKNKVNNFRPISNLSSLNKIFELLTYQRLNSFVVKHNIISEIQFGFRKNCNASLAIFHLISDFVSTIHDKSYTIALFLDLRKAFDVVDRGLLIEKLSLYGFRGVTNKFLQSYLSDRYQYVNINNFKSDISITSHGVPQGSVLGPLLFDIFVNDIENIDSCKKVLFADDTVLYVNDLKFKDCINKISSVVYDLTNWLNNNRLVPNTEKTKVMLITPRPVTDLQPVIFNTATLEWVDTIKYLGLFIDNKLKFNYHVDEVCNKLSKHLGVFHALSPFTPQNVLLQIYYSLVYPVISQNVTIWGGVAKYQRNRVTILINKILRKILNVKYDINGRPLMNTDLMYKELSLLKFVDVYNYFMVKFIHFIL